MFEIWLQSRKDASWDLLLDALKSPSVNMKTLASSIEDMLVSKLLYYNVYLLFLFGGYQLVVHSWFCLFHRQAVFRYRYSLHTPDTLSKSVLVAECTLRYSIFCVQFIMHTLTDTLITKN